MHLMIIRFNEKKLRNLDYFSKLGLFKIVELYKNNIVIFYAVITAAYLLKKSKIWLIL
jgi:hypothetical protein